MQVDILAGLGCCTHMSSTIYWFNHFVINSLTILKQNVSQFNKLVMHLINFFWSFSDQVIYYFTFRYVLVFHNCSVMSATIEWKCLSQPCEDDSCISRNKGYILGDFGMEFNRRKFPASAERYIARLQLKSCLAV